MMIYIYAYLSHGVKRVSVDRVDNMVFYIDELEVYILTPASPDCFFRRDASPDIDIQLG